MGSPISRSARVLILLVGGAIALAAWVGWRVARDPAFPFLTHDAAAEWILFPAPPSTLAHPGEEVETAFRASFDLASVPARATLRARCFHAGDATLNDTPVDVPCAGETDWKRTVEGDVARALRPGANVLSVRVRSRFGPPALWLSIEGTGIRAATGARWEASQAGSPWRPARLATTPMDRWELETPGGATGTPSVADPTVLEAARHSLPAWIAFAAACGALLLAVRRLPQWLASLEGGSAAEVERLVAPILAGFGALLWCMLVWNNLWVVLSWSGEPGVAPPLGFDLSSHLEYIQYILERGGLPLAHEGWEMYQPPLYYLMASGLLACFGQVTLDQAMAILRALNWAGGLLLVGALYESLRLLHPNETRRVLRGFLLGAFLPAQLYMTHYVSNEIWSAALASASIAVAIRILVRSPDSIGLHLLLGALMGAALLTKFSTVMVVAVIVAVLVGRRVVDGGSSTVIALRTVGGMLAACAAVCGWHFLRVALRFGNPLIGNWDPQIGYTWWQDPGYHTAGYYTGFGAALHRPVYSAFHSFADAFYSTLWGDGMIGGSALVEVRPPWDFGSMTAGYLLAILPTVAILVGTVAALAQLVRAPRAEGWLVLGVLGATAYGVFYMTLRLPFYAQAKAFYGLSAFIPLAVLGSLGLGVLARRAPAAHAVFDVLLGVWAINAFVTFWIRL